MNGRHTAEDLAFLREKGFGETADEIERLQAVEDAALKGGAFECPACRNAMIERRCHLCGGAGSVDARTASEYAPAD